MAVNQEFDIPDDPVEITTNDSETLTIEFPYLHSEHSGIKCRLLSYAWREGQVSGTFYFLCEKDFFQYFLNLGNLFVSKR